MVANVVKMNTPLNTPQRHGSVPLAHSTPTTLDLSSAVGSHTHLIEQAASAATLPAWPQGRGETGRLAFIQSIPNGWTTEQQNSVANYLTASSIITVDSLSFMEDADWTDEIWGPDADQARPGDITHPQLRVLVRAARAFTDKRRIEAGEAPFWQAVHQTVHQPQAPVQNQAKSNPPRVETIEQGIMHADGFLEYTESLAVHYDGQGKAQLAIDLRAVAVNPKGVTETQVGSPTDKMLAADIVNGGPLPAVLKDVAKGSGADMTSGLAIVRAVLQDFSKQNDQTLTMMADQFREWPPIPAHAAHTLLAELGRWDTALKRLQNDEYAQHRLDQLKSLRSMVTNIGAAYDKIKFEGSMESDLGQGEKLKAETVRKELDVMAKRLHQQWNFKQNLKHTNQPKPKPPGKPVGKPVRVAVAEPKMAKTPCFEHFDFGTCTNNDARHRDMYDHSEKTEKKGINGAVIGGMKLCPWMRRFGKCTLHDKCKYADSHQQWGATPPSAAMVAAPQATVMMAAAPQSAQPTVAPPQVHAAAPADTVDIESMVREAVAQAVPQLLAQVLGGGWQHKFANAVTKIKIAAQTLRSKIRSHRQRATSKARNTPGLGCILDSGAAKPLMNQHEHVESQQPISPVQIMGIDGKIGLQASKQGYIEVMGKKISTLITNSKVNVLGPQHLAEHGVSTVFAPQGTFISNKTVAIPQESIQVPYIDGLPHIPAKCFGQYPCKCCTFSAHTNKKEMEKGQRIKEKGKRVKDKGQRISVCSGKTVPKRRWTVAKQEEHNRAGHPFDARCEACVRSRLVQRSAVRKTEKQVLQEQAEGFAISVDTIDGLPLEISGRTAALIGVESCGYPFVNLQKGKGGAEVVKSINKFEAELREVSGGSKDVVRLHSDAAQELNKGLVKQMTDDKGWQNTNGGGNRDNGNARCERMVRTLLEVMVANLITATGDPDAYHEELWGQGLLHAADVVARRPRSGRHGDEAMAPHEKLSNKKYVHNKNDHVFGALVMHYIPRVKRQSKSTPRADRAIWLRQQRNVPGGHVVAPIVWNKDKLRWTVGKPMVATTVRVFDRIFPLRLLPAQGSPSTDFAEFLDAFDPEGEGHSSERMDDEICEIRRIIRQTGAHTYLVEWEGYPISEATEITTKDLTQFGATDMLQEFKRKKLDERHKQSKHTKQSKHKMTLRKRVKAAVFKAMMQGEQGQEQVVDTIARLMKQQHVEGNPQEWVAPYNTELNEVIRRRMRELVGQEKERVRKRNLAVKLRMLLELKRCGRKKCRLILQGFREPYYWDKEANDSPVAGYQAIRMLLFMARQTRGGLNRWISKIDIAVAFLQADAYSQSDPTRYVYIQEAQDKVNRYFELLGPLYGSRSSSKRWHNTMVGYLISKGYIQGNNDPCVFTNPNTEHVIVLWVDDILSLADTSTAHQFYKDLGARFEVKAPEYLTPATPLDFVSFVIHEERQGEQVTRYISQQEAIEQFGKTCGVVRRPGVRCPMPSKHTMFMPTAAAEQSLDAQQQVQYQRQVGMLNYLVTTVRYDVAHAASRLGAMAAAPTASAQRDLIRTVQYLVNTSDFKVGGVVPKKENWWRVFSDSDHAGDRNLSTRSQTGTLIFLNGIPVQWRSQKQPITSFSSAAAEIYALSQTIKDARYARWVANEMGINTTSCVQVEVDNDQAISFQRGTCPSTKLKGVYDLRWEWVQEIRREGEVKCVAVNTKHNCADLLTKCLKREDFERLLGLCQEQV